MLALLAAAAAGFILREIGANAGQGTSNAGVEPCRIELPGEPYPSVLFLSPVQSFGRQESSCLRGSGRPEARAIGGCCRWMWPSALAVGAAIFLLAGIAYVRAGSDDSSEGWRLSSPPPMQADIRVHAPDSEWSAPLFWALGAGAVAATFTVAFGAARTVYRAGDARRVIHPRDVRPVARAEDVGDLRRCAAHS